jgi:hypothetical protein
LARRKNGLAVSSRSTSIIKIALEYELPFCISLIKKKMNNAQKNRRVASKINGKKYS